MKLFQISGKKVLQSFIHSQPTDIVGGREDGPSSLEPIMEEGEGGDDGMTVEEKATMSVECVGFSNNDLKFIASGGMDCNLKIWDIVTGTCRVTCPHKGGVVALSWHSKYPSVTTSSLDGNIRVWDARSGAMLLELTGHMNSVTSLDMKCIQGGEGEGEGDVDIISSVSDDLTAKVFHIRMRDLLS